MGKRKDTQNGQIPVVLPPVRVQVKTPFPEGGCQSNICVWGETVTTLYPHTKDQLLEQLDMLRRVIAGTENDGLGGGVIVVVRRKAKSEEEA